nr:hypothetical protein [Methylobacterium sp. Leaf122]
MRLVAIVLLLAGPALAAEPAYVDRWAEMADAKCSEPLLITATTMEALGDDSWQCQLPATAPGARSWTLRVQCAQEGTDYRQTQNWILTGETLGAQRLTQSRLRVSRPSIGGAV